MDGVTDDRSDGYIRFYVGQSFNLPIRVSIDHPGEIRYGNTRRIHYFVLARGHGRRYAHILRLWALTNPTIDGLEAAEMDRFSLAQNALEMMFCRAFESLPDTVLSRFYGAAEYSDVSLNNLLPLFQGRTVPATVCAKYLEYHRASPDPDTSAFVDIRKRQNAKCGIAESRYTILLRGDYRQAIEELVNSAQPPLWRQKTSKPESR